MPHLRAGRRYLLGSKDKEQEGQGSEGNIGKEGPSLKDKMLPTWEGSGRQGDLAGRLATEGVKEMVVGWGWGREGRMQAVMEPWPTRQ